MGGGSSKAKVENFDDIEDLDEASRSSGEEEEKEEKFRISDNDDDTDDQRDEDEENNKNEDAEQEDPYNLAIVEERGFFGKKRTVIVDPEMPHMFEPVKYAQVFHRTKICKASTFQLMKAVELASLDAIATADSIPVLHETERISVSQEIEDAIGRKRTYKQIKMAIDSNLKDILKMLNWERMVFEMMNFNTDGEQLRRLKPVDLVKAREVIRPN